VDASHFDTSIAYAAVNRFRLDDLHPYIYRTRDGGKSWQKIVTGLPDNEPVNTVREDPERKGLLFAGTERTVYVSFDDGDHWQSLQQNLPPTSIRDLVIHNDDIVVGTHGRSFWILDNITPLRQLNAEVAAALAHLFAPQLTYRVRRNNNTDTPLPPEEPAGQNPPDGAIIDYWLGEFTPPDRLVTLEIVDASSGRVVRNFSSLYKSELALESDNSSKGHVVRRYSSLSLDQSESIKEKDFNVPMYWARPSRTLSAAPGMHRFVWDLTYPAPDVLSRDFPMSAIVHDTPLYPLGATVLPGKYAVTLKVATEKGAAGTQVLAQPLEIRLDPRVKTSPDDLRRQFELDRKIADALHRDYEAIKQVRSLRAQLKSLANKKLSQEVKTAAAALDAKLSALEGSEGGWGTSFLSTPEGRSLARLNGGFKALLSALDSADAAPTTQQSAMFEELEKALAEQLAAWNQIKTKDVPDLNAQLKKAGLTALDPQKVTGEQPGQIVTRDRDAQ